MSRRKMLQITVTLAMYPLYIGGYWLMLGPFPIEYPVPEMQIYATLGVGTASVMALILWIPPCKRCGERSISHSCSSRRNRDSNGKDSAENPAGREFHTGEQPA